MHSFWDQRRASATRRIVRATVLGATVAALAACGSGSAPRSAGTNDAPAPAADGGTVRYVAPVEPRSLDPNVDGTRHSMRVQAAFTDRLMGKDGEERPNFDGLVTDLDVADDSFTVTVRPGVTFHNGEKLDAAAVAYSFAAADEYTGTRFAEFFGKAKPVGDDRVRVPLKLPIGRRTIEALLTVVAAVPPKYHAEAGERFGRKPVGTGPFVFGSWQSGRQITAKRFDGYWGPAPKLDGIEVLFNKSDAGRVSLVQAGNAEITAPVSPGVFRGVERSAARGASRDGRHTTHLGFAPEGPTADPRVREAIAHLIDRDAIAGRVYLGEARPRTTMFGTPFDPADAGETGADVAFPYDVDRAKALIAEAKADGVSVGDPITLSYPNGHFPLDDQLGQAVSGSLKAAGLNIRQNPIEAGTFIEKWLAGDLRGAYLANYSAEWSDLNWYASTFFIKGGTFPYCVTPELDRAARQAVVERDDATARKQFDAIQRTAIREERCIVPIQQLKDNYTFSPRLQGFNPRMDSLIAWEQLSLAP